MSRENAHDAQKEKDTKVTVCVTVTVPERNVCIMLKIRVVQKCSVWFGEGETITGDTFLIL